MQPTWSNVFTNYQFKTRPPDFRTTHYSHAKSSTLNTLPHVCFSNNLYGHLNICQNIQTNYLNSKNVVLSLL